MRRSREKDESQENPERGKREFGKDAEGQGFERRNPERDNEVLLQPTQRGWRQLDRPEAHLLLVGFIVERVGLDVSVFGER